MLEQKDVLDYDSDGNTTEVTRSFYHRSALGSVMEITDMNQAEVVSYRYDPYGKVTITRGGTSQSSDPLGNHWTFTGRFLDEESGLLYYRARYYDPATGRFLQRDPLGYAEGPSLFEYANSSPVNERDPSGAAGPDSIVIGEDGPPPKIPAPPDAPAITDLEDQLGDIYDAQITLGDELEAMWEVFAAGATDPTVTKAQMTSLATLITEATKTLDELKDRAREILDQLKDLRRLQRIARRWPAQVGVHFDPPPPKSGGYGGCVRYSIRHKHQGVVIWGGSGAGGASGPGPLGPGTRLPGPCHGGTLAGQVTIARRALAWCATAHWQG
jgi:RHS repeat-associated protein